MDEKNDQVVLRRIVAGRKSSGMRNSNSQRQVRGGQSGPQRGRGGKRGDKGFYTSKGSTGANELARYKQTDDSAVGPACLVHKAK